MPLGRLTTDWKQLDKSQAMIRLAASMPAMKYFTRTSGPVYEAKTNTLDADFLVSTDRDFQSAVPSEVKFKAFKKGGVEAAGMVVQEPNNDLKFYDALGNQVMAASVAPARLTFMTHEYEKLGAHGGNIVYGRLDRAAIGTLHAGSRLTAADLDVFEGSMRKGIIPSSSTGSDGIKFESLGPLWVIKITIAMGNAHGIDNTLSPAATEVRDVPTKRIYLTFNQLVMRH